MVAALTHHVSSERLKAISANIPKVTIVTGDSDNLVRPDNSHVLKQHMRESELIVWDKTGHALHAQWPKRFSELANRTFEEGKRIYSDIS